MSPDECSENSLTGSRHSFQTFGSQQGKFGEGVCLLIPLFFCSLSDVGFWLFQETHLPWLSEAESSPSHFFFFCPSTGLSGLCAFPAFCLLADSSSWFWFLLAVVAMPPTQSILVSSSRLASYMGLYYAKRLVVSF